MSILSPPTLVLALLALSWVQFAFVAERSNPFVRPRPPLLRSRWCYGRRVGAAMMLGGACALLTNVLPSVPPVTALGVGALVYAAIAIPSAIAFHRHGGIWGKTGESAGAGAAPGGATPPPSEGETSSVGVSSSMDGQPPHDEREESPGGAYDVPSDDEVLVPAPRTFVEGAATVDIARLRERPPDIIV